jgi:predicted AlkP superfamily phosphohydrolase/phosphomutase
MLSGYPSPDFQNPAGYPMEWAKKIGPLFDISAIAINNEDRLIDECHKFVRRVGNILISQLKKGECDVYCIVFSSTDFLQHYLWKYLSNENSKYSKAIENIYIEIDKYIGKSLELFDNEKCTFVVLSDHGFTSSAEKYFHTNAWLVNEGYLVCKRKSLLNKTLDLLLNPLRYQKVGLRSLLKSYFSYLPVNIQKKVTSSYYDTNLFQWTQSKASRHRIGMAEGIVINLKNRQPLGVVEESEYEALRHEIVEKIKKLRDEENGSQIVSEVYRREELYNGEFVEFLPDIIFMLDSKYHGGVGINSVTENASEESKAAISGVHDMDGILILSGPKIREGEEIQSVSIIDIFPTILYDLELPMPNYVDGKVIRDVFKEEFASQSINYYENPFFEKKDNSNLSSKEEDAMKEALKSLGYLS